MSFNFKSVPAFLAERITMRHVIVAVAVLLIVGLAFGIISSNRGGGESVDASDPELRGISESLMEFTKYGDAINRMDDFIRHNPDNALAHFQMGLLLQDNKNDDASALYHFRQFIKLSPDSDKKTKAEERIGIAEERLGAKFGGAGTARTSVDNAQIAARLEELNAKIADRNRTIQRLRDQTQDLTKENNRLGKDVKSLHARLQFFLDSDPTIPPEMQTRPSAAKIEAQRPYQDPFENVAPGARKYRVERGDTLWSIAQLFYGDASRNKDIRNANPGRIGPNDKLTQGVELIIPFP